MTFPRHQAVKVVLAFEPTIPTQSAGFASQRKTTKTTSVDFEEILKAINPEDLEESFKRSVRSFANQWDDINGYPSNQQELMAMFKRAMTRFEIQNGFDRDKRSRARLVLNLLEEHYLGRHGPRRDDREFLEWTRCVYDVVADLKASTLLD